MIAPVDAEKPAEVARALTSTEAALRDLDSAPARSGAGV
jgi:hypothetical protein